MLNLLLYLLLITLLKHYTTSGFLLLKSSISQSFIQIISVDEQLYRIFKLQSIIYLPQRSCVKVGEWVAKVNLSQGLARACTTWDSPQLNVACHLCNMIKKVLAISTLLVFEAVGRQQRQDLYWAPWKVPMLRCFFCLGRLRILGIMGLSP